MICWYELEDGEYVQKKTKSGKYPKGEYQFIDGLFVRVSFEAPKWEPLVTVKRSAGNVFGSAPNGIMDSIEVVNVNDGKTYSSKSKYYQALKDKDCHVIETGELKNSREMQGDFNNRRELQQAIQQHLGR